MKCWWSDVLRVLLQLKFSFKLLPVHSGKSVQTYYNLSEQCDFQYVRTNFNS